MPQPTEDADKLFIIVVDETYGGNESTYTIDSEQYQKDLQREFQANFQVVNVGPGADLPGFLTDLAKADFPLWPAVVATFFLGKQVKENFDAWIEMGRTVQRFFARPIIVARHGAAVLAIAALFDEVGGTPKSLRLVRYRAGHISERGSLARADLGSGIEENPPTLNLGYVVHFFEIESDGQLFRIAVDGKQTEVVKIGYPSAQI